jgi:NAD(P)-dependent dehydrogenase (short-subunit alcohol dehydrogenase family)
MTNSLKGQVALVTGASRGIGRGIAQRLAADGALVVVHYAGNSAAAAETVAAIEADGGAAFSVGQPFGDPDDAAQLFAKLDAELERRTGSTHLDVLVNNAGIALQGGLAETTAEVFDSQFAVNVRAPFFLTQAAAERMTAGGRVITISSGVTRQAWPNLLAYSMSKAAVDVMARTLAKELAPRGITVNVVAAGLVDTDMNAAWLRASDEARAQAASASAFGRVGEPRDIADVVAFVASENSRFVTGQVLDATGGSVL